LPDDEARRKPFRAPHSQQLDGHRTHVQKILLVRGAFPLAGGGDGVKLCLIGMGCRRRRNSGTCRSIFVPALQAAG
jgi:hypothetical protein